MAPETESNNQFEKFAWLIVDFPLNESHLEEFLVFLAEFVKKFSPKADAHGQGSVYTVENVAYFPFLDPTNRPKQAGLITFEGYEIFQGKQRLIKDLIAFSVQPSSSDLVTISGVPNPGLILYFSSLLLEISTRWEESTPSIAKYLNRVELIIETSKKEENQKVEVPEAQGSETIASPILSEKKTTRTPRQRRPRYGVVDRVAISIYAHEKREFPSLGDAAKRFGTRVTKIKELSNHPEVMKLLDDMRKNPSYADKVRLRVANQRKKPNERDKRESL